jgi:hypothetical protein
MQRRLRYRQPGGVGNQSDVIQREKDAGGYGADSFVSVDEGVVLDQVIEISRRHPGSASMQKPPSDA